MRAARNFPPKIYSSHSYNCRAVGPLHDGGFWRNREFLQQQPPPKIFYLFICCLLTLISFILFSKLFTHTNRQTNRQTLKCKCKMIRSMNFVLCVLVSSVGGARVLFDWQDLWLLCDNGVFVLGWCASFFFFFRLFVSVIVLAALSALWMQHNYLSVCLCANNNKSDCLHNLDLLEINLINLLHFELAQLDFKMVDKILYKLMGLVMWIVFYVISLIYLQSPLNGSNKSWVHLKFPQRFLRKT